MLLDNTGMEISKIRYTFIHCGIAPIGSPRSITEWVLLPDGKVTQTEYLGHRVQFTDTYTFAPQLITDLFAQTPTCRRKSSFLDARDKIEITYTNLSKTLHSPAPACIADFVHSITR